MSGLAGLVRQLIKSYLKSGSERTHTCFLSSQTASSLPQGETVRQLTDFPVSSSVWP